MLPNRAEIHDRSTPAFENAFPRHTGAMTERFRQHCLDRLDAAGAKTPRPIHRGGRGGRPDPEAIDDPAVSAIEEWRAARHAYLAHRREIEPLWNAVPEWVRNWHGVYAGQGEGADGEAVPILARTEEALNECYDRRSRDAGTPQAAQRIENRRREALAELRLTLAAAKGACAAAGLPFDRGLEDAYWGGFRERIARAETAVESTPARTARGIEARCRHAARLIAELRDGGGGHDLVQHVHNLILRIASDVADILDD